MPRITNNQNIQAWDKETNYIIQKFTDEGDFYRKHVINPALFSLLGNVEGKKILDAGSGQGYLSRYLAKKGAKVTALEPAEGLINYAIQREKKEKLGISFIKADLSKWIGTSNYFDIVVSNMVFMDIPDYKNAIKNCISAIKSKGIFIFSISHPCFDVVEGWQENKPYVEVKNYFEEYQIHNYIGYSFHHMLSDYVNLLIEEGCCIKKMLEPRLLLTVANKDKQHERDKHVPNFLLIQAVKN